MSFSYLHKDYIALGTSDNTLELYKVIIQYQHQLEVKSPQQDSLCIRTYHQKGIHSINVINEHFFITGGGNGSFIIWNINNLQMINAVYDNERNNFPINKVLTLNCPLSKHTLVSCFDGKGIAFWISQSDVDESER